MRSALTRNKTSKELVSEMASDLRSLKYSSYDMEMVGKSFDFFHKIMMVYYNGASEEIMQVFRSQLEVATDNKSKILIIICVLMSISMLFSMIMLYCLRYTQNQEEE